MPSMRPNMLDVFGFPTSINVRKVLWTCSILDLPYRLVAVSGDALHDPAFVALNPNAQVPVIRDGSLVLSQSNTICRYLVARAGRDDLLPVSADGRARVEYWMDWQATELNTAWRPAFMARVRRDPRWPDDATAEDSLRRWNRLMRIVDDHLRGGHAHLAGTTFTLADVVIGLSTQRWRSTPGDKPQLAYVDAWFARLGRQPGFHDWVDNGTP